MQFDIVICLGPHDIHIIHEMIIQTKQNVVGYRNIYIVSYDKNIKVDGCITIDENIFPFNKAFISKYIQPNQKIKEDRSGWYLQQLLKLYSCFVIDNILDNILIIDADTFFYKKTTFFENNIPLYNYSEENHIEYFEHMHKLHPSLKKVDFNKSGISHHIVVQKHILVELFNLIETYHKKKFYKVFIENVDSFTISSASEYEIYFNYILQYISKDLYKIRKLKFTNLGINQLYNPFVHDFDYISYHWYLPY